MKMRKMLALAMALCLLVGQLPATAWAAEETETQAGENAIPQESATQAQSVEEIVAAAETTEVTESTDATEAPETQYALLPQGEKVAVSYSYSNDNAYFSFIPAVTGTYIFESIGETCVYGYIYDAAMNCLARNYYNGIGENFWLSYQLEAGTEYILRTDVLGYTSAGTYYVFIDHDHSYSIEVMEAASCEAEGQARYSCACGSSYVGSLDGHTYGDNHQCSLCGANQVISGTEKDTIQWSLDLYTGQMTLSGTGAMYDYRNKAIIPWYDYFDDIKSLGVEEGITRIGEEAFANCTNLCEVALPQGLTSIGDYAFSECRELKINMPASVTEIGENAFGTFGIDEMYIEDLAAWSGINFNSDSVLNSGSKFYVNGELITDLVIPDGVTAISDGAFYFMSQLKSITIPDSVTTIGFRAFYYCCNVEKVTFGSGLTTLGAAAFSYMESLTELTLPEGVTAIPDYTFQYCDQLQKIHIPASVTAVQGTAFSDCSALTEFAVAEDNGSFCTVDGVLYSKDMTVLVRYPAGKQAECLQIPATVTSLADDACESAKKLKGVVIPDGVTVLPSQAFENSGLTAVTIGRHITEIGNYAFRRCSALTEITFAGNLPEFGYSVFSSVKATAYYPSNNETWTADKLTNYGGTLTWEGYALPYGPCGDLVWELEDGVLTIRGIGAMNNFALNEAGVSTAPWAPLREQITEVVVQHPIHTVGQYAFYGCTNLTKATMIGAIEIGDYAFYGCSSLADLNLREDMDYLGSYAFCGCTALTQLVIPEGITDIGEAAFAECTGLTHIELGQNTQYIGIDAFTGCSNLQTVTGTEQLTAIDEGAFCGCSSLTAFTFGRKVSSIGDVAFAGTGLTEITFCGEPADIGENAFGGVTATAYYPSLYSEFWTEEVMLSYGGALTWQLYQMDTITGTCGENLTWSVDIETGTLIISGTGDMYDYEDPSPRTATGFAPWNDLAEGIVRLVVEDGVTCLSTYAFACLYNLTDAVLAGSVEAVGNYAFYNCSSLDTVDLGSGVQVIGMCAFDSCTALTQISLPEELLEIRDGAFGNTGLTSVTIPASVESVATAAFIGCTALTDIFVADGHPFACSVDGVVYSTDMTMLAIYPGGREGSYEIPEGVTLVVDYAFAASAISEVTMPESLTEIGAHAFSYCENLQSVRFGSNVQAIGASAFSGCTALTTVDLPASLTQLGDYAFGWSGLTRIAFMRGERPDIGITPFAGVTADVWYDDNYYWPSDYKEDMGGSLTWCDIILGKCGPDLTWLYDGESATLTISGTGPMYNYMERVPECSLEEETAEEITVEDESPWQQKYIETIIIEEGVTTIGAHAFESISLGTEFTLPSTITKIGDYAFVYAYDTPNLTLPAALTYIGEGAFAGWNTMQSLTIPDNVTWIGDGAFSSCSGLQALTLGRGVDHIGGYAFGDCEGLSMIYFLGDAPASISENAFSYVTATVMYPVGNETWTEDVTLDYGGTLTWMETDVPNTGGDTSWRVEETTLYITGTGPMDDYTFNIDTLTTNAPWSEYSDVLTKVVVEKGVTTVGKGAFGGFSALVEVELPSTVTEIRESAFDTCTALENVAMPQSLEKIGVYAFYACTSLTQIDIPAGVTAIEEGAFSYSGLTGITLPATLEVLEAYAFEQCSALTDVWFEGSAPSIAENAFYQTVAAVHYINDETWTEDVMQQYGGTLTWLREGRFALSGTSVSLGDSLDMHFIIDPVYVDASCYAVLTRYFSNGTDEVTLTVPYSGWNALDDGRLYVTYSGIAAKEMGDYVTVEIYDGSGSAISELYVDSVKSYAMRMLGKEEVIADEELRTLYVDMLNYGAAAQAQFGYNVTMPANDLLTDEQKAYATASYETENGLVSGTGRAGTTLTLKSRITLDFIFKNSAIGTDYTGLYAVATYVDHYGNAVETTIDTVKVFDDSYGYVSVPGLAVADYGQAVTCTVYDAEGNAIAWATDSMEGYAHRMAGKLPQIVDAIMKFSVSSYNHFH